MSYWLAFRQESQTQTQCMFIREQPFNTDVSVLKMWSITQEKPSPRHLYKTNIHTLPVHAKKIPQSRLFPMKIICILGCKENVAN